MMRRALPFNRHSWPSTKKGNRGSSMTDPLETPLFTSNEKEKYSCSRTSKEQAVKKERTHVITFGSELWAPKFMEGYRWATYSKALPKSREMTSNGSHAFADCTTYY